MTTDAQMGTAYQDNVSSRPPVNDFAAATTPAHPARETRPRRSSWAKELEDRFRELTSLPMGWDGYKGTPVSLSCARFAAILIERLCVESLPAPQLVPVSDGTIRLEWHMNQFDIEIDISGPYDVSACRTDLLSGKEEEIEIQTDFVKLSVWISELARDRSGTAGQDEEL